MNTQELSAVGVFEDLETAEKTIDELRKAGIPSDEIGIIGHVNSEQSVPIPLQLNTPEENAIQGVLKGGLWGAVIGVLVISAIPGLGEVSGMGRWFEMLGAAALGGVAGSVMIAFASFIFSGPQTRYYSQELEQGRFIVTVKTPQRQEEALSLLHRQRPMPGNNL